MPYVAAQHIWGLLGSLPPVESMEAVTCRVPPTEVISRLASLDSPLSTSSARRLSKIAMVSERFAETMSADDLRDLLAGYYQVPWRGIETRLPTLRGGQEPFPSLAVTLEGVFGRSLRDAEALCPHGFHDSIRVVAGERVSYAPVFETRPMVDLKGTAVGGASGGVSLRVGQAFGHRQVIAGWSRFGEPRWSVVQVTSWRAKVFVQRLMNGVELLRLSIQNTNRWDLCPHLKLFAARFTGPLPEIFASLAMGLLIFYLPMTNDSPPIEKLATNLDLDR